MSNFNLGYQIGGAPSYQLSTNQRKSKVVQPLDGIQVHVNEAFKFQTLKMPDYCHFQSNVLTLPANEYSFSLEQQALSKYKGLLEEIKNEKTKPKQEQPPAAAASSSSQSSSNSKPVYPSVNGEILTPVPQNNLLRPSIASQDGQSVTRSSTASNHNEWADFEQSRDLFDEMELKSIDDRHELANVLVNSTNQQANFSSAPATDSMARLSCNPPPPQAPPMGPSPTFSASPVDIPYTSPSSASAPSFSPRQPTTPQVPTMSTQTQIFKNANTEQNRVVNSLAGMGFDPAVAARFAVGLDTTDNETLVSCLLTFTSLVNNGNKPQIVQGALIAVSGDEKKVISKFKFCDLKNLIHLLGGSFVGCSHKFGTIWLFFRSNFCSCCSVTQY